VVETTTKVLDLLLWYVCIVLHMYLLIFFYPLYAILYLLSCVGPHVELLLLKQNVVQYAASH